MRYAMIVLALGMLPGLGWTGSAGAAEWNVLDLGRLYKEHHCMKAAGRTFRDLLGEMRIGRLHSSDWVAYADGINSVHDALITCTFGDNRGTRATLVVHSTAQPIDAHLLTRRIAQVFDGHARQITKAWKDSYK